MPDLCETLHIPAHCEECTTIELNFRRLLQITIDDAVAVLARFVLLFDVNFTILRLFASQLLDIDLA